jgi:Mn2+/Fe2+ NRAMP family transporter
VTGALGGDQLQQVQQGLRMAHPPDPEQLRREAAWLDALAARPWPARMRGWLSLSGPGWLQSALTLGAGTATASLFGGAVFGYALLWVAPVGMLLGIVMLAALAHQTLSTGARPLAAMSAHAGRPFAIAWAASALLASVVWHVPQYNLGAAAVVDLLAALGLAGVPPLAVSPLLLVAAVWLSWSYGRSPALVRRYERWLKWMVWAVVLSLLWVVLSTGTDWAAVAHGLVPFRLPADRGGHSAFELAVSGLSAAVGINMVFLYPYSLLARGWGRSHRGLARCDLVCGMLLPYVLATSLMTIAAGNTLFRGESVVERGAAIGRMSGVLGEALGPLAGRLVFDLGLLAMALSTISLHMLVCGFVAVEWFGCAVGSRAQRLWSLLPAPACLAPLLFAGVPVWLGVPTNIACGLLLPVTYVGILLLHRSRAYLGADRPRGVGGGLWLLAMLAAIGLLVAAFGLYLAPLVGI